MNWQLVGQITKAHGIKGELYLFLYAKTQDWSFNKSLKVAISYQNDTTNLNKNSAQKAAACAKTSATTTNLAATKDIAATKDLTVTTNLTSALAGALIDFKFLTLKSIRPQSNGFIIRVDEVTSRNQAEDLGQPYFFIPKDLLIAKPGDNFYLNEILFFEVYDKDQLLGTIEGFSSNGPQDLLKVKVSNPYHKSSNDLFVEVLIPLIDPFIKQIDHSLKKVFLELPEGLIQVQLPGT